MEPTSHLYQEDCRQASSPQVSRFFRRLLREDNGSKACLLACLRPPLPIVYYRRANLGLFVDSPHGRFVSYARRLCASHFRRGPASRIWATGALPREPPSRSLKFQAAGTAGTAGGPGISRRPGATPSWAWARGVDELSSDVRPGVRGRSGGTAEAPSHGPNLSMWTLASWPEAGVVVELE